MKSFYDKEEYTIDDINSLIDNEVEESIYLEFKEVRALDKCDGKKTEIAKDVSSFANSDGGIIIYGIQEKDHKAESITPIDGNIYTKEWLEHIINSNIHRNIPDLRIIPIRIDGKIDQSLYIMKIPYSLEAPHQSKDKKFYKRYNFESVPMEEYEIRQLYGRKVKSILKIDQWDFNKSDSEK
jgi:predicted HTH transcriptional regulator